MKSSAQFADITDEQLEVHIKELTHDNQLIGPNAVRARLLAKGLKVNLIINRCAQQLLSHMVCYCPKICILARDDKIF